MATKVTITFTVDEENYNDYEDILTDFDSGLQEIDVTDLEVREESDGDENEEDVESVNEDGVVINKTSSVEIDSEIFYDHISDTHTSWSFDKDDIEDYPEVIEYLEKYEPNELKALRNGEIKYLEVYRDTF